ncbi:MAG: DNA alkylation repair protein [Planctomycetes bacterium]|nr:DNA alkylation repair protein [Planctomycetota bacterium]
MTPRPRPLQSRTKPQAPARRKGARSRADIPPEVLAALNAGAEEALTLAESLAIDMGVLLANVLRDLGMEDALDSLRPMIAGLAGVGVMQRMAVIGQSLWEALDKLPARRRGVLFESLASHRSDTVRQWASVAAMANPSIDLARRLVIARRFAADPHMGVREIAWWSVRPAVAQHIEEAIALLQDFVVSDDPNVRRYASELTRPRGVWCKSIPELRSNPELGLPILEPLRDDPSRYVQNSVANWLNDASKDRPEWVEAVCRRWLKESDTPRTAWIVARARRTLRKQSDAATRRRTRR